MGIAANAGFGSDGPDAAELRRADGQKVKTGFKLVEAVFAASDVRTSG
jgi:hypothetical protein